jgi:hypothetical protein
MQFITDSHIGDIASILGVLLAIVGFSITFNQAKNAKTAAQQAKEEVQKLRQTLTQVNTIADLTAAMGAMEELKRLNRTKTSWHMLPDRYSAIRGMLNTIRSANPDFSGKHKLILQGATQQLSIIEEQVDYALASEATNTLDPAEFNRVISEQMDKLNEVLIVVKQKIGE